MISFRNTCYSYSLRLLKTYEELIDECKRKAERKPRMEAYPEIYS